jgi:hypothetical protein
MRFCTFRTKQHASTTRAHASSYNITHADFCVSIQETAILKVAGCFISVSCVTSLNGLRETHTAEFSK